MRYPGGTFQGEDVPDILRAAPFLGEHGEEIYCEAARSSGWFGYGILAASGAEDIRMESSGFWEVMTCLTDMTAIPGSRA